MGDHANAIQTQGASGLLQEAGNAVSVADGSGSSPPLVSILVELEDLILQASGLQLSPADLAAIKDQDQDSGGNNAFIRAWLDTKLGIRVQKRSPYACHLSQEQKDKYNALVQACVNRYRILLQNLQMGSMLIGGDVFHPSELFMLPEFAGYMEDTLSQQHARAIKQGNRGGRRPDSLSRLFLNSQQRYYVEVLPVMDMNLYEYAKGRQDITSEEEILDSTPKKVVVLAQTVIADIMKSFLAAVAYFHQKTGLAHRDIKPGNVLISEISAEDGRCVRVVKLGDFDSAVSEANSYAGTPLFYAPGYFRRMAGLLDQPDDVDAWRQEDLWAVGASLLSSLAPSDSSGKVLHLLNRMQAYLVYLSLEDDAARVAFCLEISRKYLRCGDVNEGRAFIQGAIETYNHPLNRCNSQFSYDVFLNNLIDSVFTERANKSSKNSDTQEFKDETKKFLKDTLQFDRRKINIAESVEILTNGYKYYKSASVAPVPQPDVANPPLQNATQTPVEHVLTREATRRDPSSYKTTKITESTETIIEMKGGKARNKNIKVIHKSKEPLPEIPLVDLHLALTNMQQKIAHYKELASFRRTTQKQQHQQYSEETRSILANQEDVRLIIVNQMAVIYSSLGDLITKTNTPLMQKINNWLGVQQEDLSFSDEERAKLALFIPSVLRGEGNSQDQTVEKASNRAVSLFWQRETPQHSATHNFLHNLLRLIHATKAFAANADETSSYAFNPIAYQLMQRFVALYCEIDNSSSLGELTFSVLLNQKPEGEKSILDLCGELETSEGYRDPNKKKEIACYRELKSSLLDYNDKTVDALSPESKKIFDHIAAEAITETPENLVYVPKATAI